MNRQKYILIAIVFIGMLLRFYKLDWDGGMFYHPDERLYLNASVLHMPRTIGEFLSPASPLNPRMFYYGQLPLYVYKIVSVVFGSNSFALLSRGVSALISTLSIILVYQFVRRLLDEKHALYAAALMTLAPGLIQHAHFSTTESWLVMWELLLGLLCVMWIRRPSWGLVFWMGVVLGCATGTKVTGLVFGIIPLTAWALVWWRDRKTTLLLFGMGVFLTCITGLSAILASPYNLIDLSTFLTQQTFMQSVILGTAKPPFVIIYEGTVSYIYQLIHIFPFTAGLGICIAALGGFAMALKYAAHRKKYYSLWLVIVFPIMYFAWAGSWYSKFSRYYVILVPFMCIWGSLLIVRLKRPVRSVLLALIVIQALGFMTIYFSPHTRNAASVWVYQHADKGAKMLGEHWDDQLPVRTFDQQTNGKFFTFSQLEIYNPESNLKEQGFAAKLAAADYMIISSARVKRSIEANKEKYPWTNNYYQLMQKGRLGYRLVHTEMRKPYGIDDAIWADESFGSYDHPPVYVYQNVEHLTETQLLSILNGPMPGVSPPLTRSY